MRLTRWCFLSERTFSGVQRLVDLYAFTFALYFLEVSWQHLYLLYIIICMHFTWICLYMRTLHMHFRLMYDFKLGYVLRESVDLAWVSNTLLFLLYLGLLSRLSRHRFVFFAVYFDCLSLEHVSWLSYPSPFPCLVIASFPSPVIVFRHPFVMISHILPHLIVTVFPHCYHLSYPFVVFYPRLVVMVESWFVALVWHWHCDVFVGWFPV